MVVVVEDHQQASCGEVKIMIQSRNHDTFPVA